MYRFWWVQRGEAQTGHIPLQYHHQAYSYTIPFLFEMILHQDLILLNSKRIYIIDTILTILCVLTTKFRKRNLISKHRRISISLRKFLICKTTMPEYLRPARPLVVSISSVINACSKILQ